MKHRRALILFLLVAGNVPLAQAASPPPVTHAAQSLVTMEDGLRQVIDEALTANLELQASGATVRQRLAALDQARARYLPVIDFAARYSVADGGRTIDFPVGDLLNPVYETLDQMLLAQGQAAQFPRVQNESIAFLRDQEQETKLLLEQPLYEPRIGPAVDATRADAARAEADLAALRSQVIRDVKQAYYRWIAAQQAVMVLDATLEATRENLKANASLYRNGKVTRDLVYRAEADVLEVEQERLATASRVRIAQSYVNLLRNAPLAQSLPNAALDAETIERFRARLLAVLAGRQADAPKLQDLASQRREELKSLDAAIAVGEARQDLARAAFKPSLAFGAEAGIQGTDYGFADEDRYVLASLVLRFNAFRGGADQAALREARALTEQLRATRELAGQRVRLEVQQALENFEVAEASLDTAAKRAEAANGAFAITSRKRDLGQINQAEFIDARRAQTDAQLNVTRVRAEYLARLAELEFSIGDARRLDQERM
ncbi:MAG: TolC family protein [Proteobacteria bacterium]|nr:TolC family protein [Pseudomonadota bacterium]